MRRWMHGFCSVKNGTLTQGYNSFFKFLVYVLNCYHDSLIHFTSPVNQFHVDLIFHFQYKSVPRVEFFFEKKTVNWLHINRSLVFHLLVKQFLDIFGFFRQCWRPTDLFGNILDFNFKALASMMNVFFNRNVHVLWQKGKNLILTHLYICHIFDSTIRFHFNLKWKTTDRHIFYHQNCY